MAAVRIGVAVVAALAVAGCSTGSGKQAAAPEAVPTPSASSPATSSSCVPVRVIGFRGSGDQKVTDPAGNGWSGALLTAVAIRSRSLHFSDGHGVAAVPVDGVDYTAIAPDNLLKFASGLSASVQDGVTKGLAAVRAATAGCDGRTHVVLTGFSQGAMVARQIAEQAPRGTVSGVLLVGDPQQRPGADGTQGPGREGQGIMRGLLGQNDDAYYALPVHRISFCHAGDPICAFSAADVLSAAAGNAHADYGNDPAELTSLAVDLADLERMAAGLPAAQAS